ncbi:MAG: LemA family protein [Bacillota bacterium]|jgi:LemA protein
MPWIIAIVVVLAAYVIVSYNSLVTKRQRVHNAWSQIDVQLRRRFDLIPNLVETVKGYASHEKEVFQRVTEARSRVASARSVDESVKAQNALEGALRGLLAVAENYPMLKASENFKELQAELSNTEGKIAFSRQFYNDTVLKYMESIQRFPSNILARMFGFGPISYFETEEEARGPVEVRF